MRGDPFAATIAAEAAPDNAPVVIDERYEILGMLGAGGMGNVYKARDRELDELVALKVLRPELMATPGVIERFRREVKLARRVTHPNVARVFDIGDRAGERILTMELVDGETLAALLERERPLPIARVQQITNAVCAGVAAAHAAGVIHRDLKPDNVLLAKDGRVLVSDFGIARAVAQVDARTQGGFIGTPAYMSPEQVEGQSEIDARADIYALGVMLYEMLVGELPWRGDSVIAVVAARLVKPPPDPRVERADLPAELAELTIRCMARAPADRFESIAAVGEALARVRVSTSASVAPPPPVRTDLAARSTEKRVAVLPFRNMGAAGDDYVAEGLTDDLIDLLSVAPGLRVAARGTVAPYKGTTGDAREVGRDLGVQLVVEGAVRKAGGAFRINARLVSVADGFQLWAKRFDGSEAEMLTLNDRVASDVAAALTVDLEPSARDLGDAEAVDFYLRARAIHHRFFSGDAQKTLALFEQAVARSPNDPRIIAGFVMCRTRNPFALATAEATLRADAERALRLAPSLPDAHVALATVQMHYGQEAAAMKPLKRALELMPSSAEAHDLLGRIMSEADRDEGRKHLETALALAPELEFARTALARHHALRGAWDTAFALLENDAAFSATVPRFYVWRRDREAAATLLAQLKSRDQADPRRPIIGAVRMLLEAVVHGTLPTADVLPSDHARKPRVRSFVAQIKCEVAAMLGDVDRALASFAESEAAGLFDISWVDRCPSLESLRGHPDFIATGHRIRARADRVIEAYLST